MSSGGLHSSLLLFSYRLIIKKPSGETVGYLKVNGHGRRKQKLALARRTEKFRAMQCHCWFSITTTIGMRVSEMVDDISAITTTSIILTEILGGTYGIAPYQWFGLKTLLLKS